jgi:serine/threonine protein kinase
MVEGRPDLDGRFTNLRRLGPSGGGGAFSLVFSALDRLTNRNVAIKVFHPDMRHDAYRWACFNREAQLLERMGGQANIIGFVAPVGEFTEALPFGVGSSFTVRFAYYAVELAQFSMDVAITLGSWTTEDLLVAFREMVKAVQRIHREQITHRDLKPANFLVTTAASIKLSDFGTARDLIGLSPALLSDYSGFPPGDKRYTAPELLAGLHDEDASIAFRADMFSLGAILFELLTGIILRLQVFDPNFADDLAAAMAAVPRGKRTEIYHQYVGAIASGHPLPSVAAFTTIVPPSVRDRVDDLYRGMAALDYRHRLCDFQQIFRRIDNCLLIVRNEERYRRWKEQKRQQRAALSSVR